MPAKKSVKDKGVIGEKGDVKKADAKKAAGAKDPVKKVKIVAQSTLKKSASILKKIAPGKIFAKGKTITKGAGRKMPLLKSKKAVAVVLALIVIVAAVAVVGLSYPLMGVPSGGSGTPTTNETKPHEPYHKEYDTPAMNGFTPGGVGVYWFHEQKFPVDANATKLTAKLTVTSKIGPRLEIHYIIKDAKGKEVKEITINSDSGGSIELSNTTLNSSGPGQYTSRIEVWKGIQVVSHVVLDVSYPTTNTTKSS